MYIFLGEKFVTSCLVISLPIDPPAPVITITLSFIKSAISGVERSTGSRPRRSSRLIFLIFSMVTFPSANWSTPGIILVSSFVFWQSSIISLVVAGDNEGIEIIICSML